MNGVKVAGPKLVFIFKYGVYEKYEMTILLQVVKVRSLGGKFIIWLQTITCFPKLFVLIFLELNYKRIVLALQSGIRRELAWAFNTLTFLSFKDKDEIRTPLAKIPGLLDALLCIVSLVSKILCALYN